VYRNTLYPRIKSFLVLYEGRCSYFHETRTRRGARRLWRVEKKNHDDGGSRNSDRLPINVSVSWDRLTRKSAILSIFLDTNYVGFRTLFRDDGGAVIEERSSREMSVINFWVSIDRQFSYFVFWTWASKGNPAGYWKASIHGGSEGGSELGRRSKMRDKELIAAFGNGPGLTGGNKFYYQIFLRLYAPRW